jgi:hypothetical protein
MKNFAGRKAGYVRGKQSVNGMTWRRTRRDSALAFRFVRASAFGASKNAAPHNPRLALMF